MSSLRQSRAASRDEFPQSLGFDDYVEMMTVGDATFPVGTTTIFGPGGNANRVEIDDHFQSHAQNIYKRNSTVFACMLLRQSIFAEITFRYQSLGTGKLFGTPALGVLERPWPNGTTGELAARMIQDVDLAGNFYAVREGDRLYRRAPHKTHIVLDGDPLQEEYVNVVGYIYQPNGTAGETYTYTPDQMCHWSPIPDPLAEYRGMSWLTPVAREILADGAATDHKLAFFRNGATPQVIVKFPPDVMDEASFDRFKAKLERDQAGVRNSGKTLYLAPGADATVTGSTLQQMDLGNSQGRDETKIAAAAGIPPVILGQKESLGGSSLNQGNYASARRRLADGTMRPLYRSAAAALESIVPAPQDKGSSRLWYDDSKVAFFREDRADSANIEQTKSTTMSNLVLAGYTPESVTAFIASDSDFSLLQHSGLFSVQLQAPGTGDNSATPTGATP